VLDDELFACVVTRSGVRLQRRLAHWPQVHDAVRSLRFQIETLRHGAAPVARHMDTLNERTRTRLAQLHAMVWAPLTALLLGRERVLIVPHAQLGWVPFAALHDGGQCVAEQHQLAVAPSARVALHGFVRRPVAAHQVVALGESSRLPRAGAEAHMVASQFARGAAFAGEQATIANLQEYAGRADVIHLACHAQFRSDNPQFSALHLHDGALTAESIELLRLKPGVVVLSACETALHEQGGGDIWGLPRAFLVAGAARVVASLWPVDDGSTADFMERFYAGLRRGQPPAAALRLAQLFMRERHEHAFYWASFVLVGGW
jgi:CHAT domain-containing protein